MLKLVDVSRLSNQELREIVHPRRRRLTTPSMLCAAMREAELRASGGLDFDRSFKLVETAAREGEVVVYSAIAEASGAPWDKVGGQIEGHLARLSVYAQARGWPMPRAMVIRDAGATADGRPGTPDGLVAAATALGFAALEDGPFLREQQDRLAEWSRETKA